MLKSVLALSILALSNVALADEVAHDAAACPDLSGKYVVTAEGQPDINATIVSAKDEAGINTLSIDAGEGASVFKLDGLKVDYGNGVDLVGACSNQTVYFYVHENGELAQTVTYALDADKNLVVVDDLRGDVITTKATRKAE